MHMHVYAMYECITNNNEKEFNTKISIEPTSLIANVYIVYRKTKDN
mgnify:CR=1 FL=1